MMTLHGERPGCDYVSLTRSYAYSDLSASMGSTAVARKAGT
jgi:hypothetical protein